MSNQQFRDLFCKSADGLKLHGRVIGPETGPALPVLCLPGLTRTTTTRLYGANLRIPPVKAEVGAI